jgi:PhnB protein
MKIGSQVYVRGSAEAVRLYLKAFGLTLEYHVLNDDGSFFHAELFSDGEFFLAVSEASTDVPAGFIPPMQFGVEFKDEAGVLNAFELLKPGAAITLPVGRLPWSDCCASLVDSFGVNWYLTVPQHKPEE